MAAPTLVTAAANCSEGRVFVRFSESMDWATVSEPANYALDGGLTVQAVTGVGDNLGYWLVISGVCTPAQTYTLTVNNVTDWLGESIATDSQIQFQCDAQAPALAGIEANCAGEPLVVQFSKSMDPVSAQNAANYALTGGIDIVAVADVGDNVHFRLTTSTPLAIGVRYTLTVNNVTDWLGNPIPGNTQWSFTCDPSAQVLSIGNLVFRDENNNGHRDPGEPGIAGVKVILYRDDARNCGLDPGDTLLATTTTGADGTFEFSHLAPTAGGPEYILEVARDNFLPGKALENLVSSDATEYLYNLVDDDDNGFPAAGPYGVVITCIRAEIGLMPTTEDGDLNTDLTMDFGFRPARPLTIGNVVFRDENNNGQQDPGEPGIDGVVMNLYRDSDQSNSLSTGDILLTSTVTHDGGSYEFSGLEGTYGLTSYLVEVAVSNFLPGGSLAGLVSSDPAYSQAQDGWADGFDHGWHVGGQFGAGTWSIWLNYGQMAMTEDGDPNTDLTIDFGFRPARPLTIGNLVFRDENNNGHRDPGEAGIDGVVVNLYRDSDGSNSLSVGDTPLTSTVTHDGGSYEFSGLERTYGQPGYLVEIAVSNFLPGGPLAGLVSSDPAYSQAQDGWVDGYDHGWHVGGQFGVGTWAIWLNYGQMAMTEDGDPNTDLTIDFGFRPARPLTIGNLVFRDDNNNGQQDPGEPGIDGVAVNLYRDSDSSNSLSPGDAFLATTLTHDGGLYEFSGLERTYGQPGYLIEIPASNFLPGGPLAGLVTSDPAYSQGQDGWTDGYDHGWLVGGEFGVGTWALWLEYGQMPMTEDGDPDTDLTEDFGFTREFRIGNLVWADLNNNGLRDPGEPGIDGVELSLYRDNGDGVLGDGDSYVRTVGTAGGGRYEFTRVTQGQYFVAIPPWLYDPGRVLNNRSSSTGNDPAPDPDNGVDNDDNGTLKPAFGGDWVVSGRLSMIEDGGPVTEDGDPNTNLTVDFGFQQGPLPSLGNLVWRDLNGNGVRDDGEPGIAGVGVSLYVDGGDGIPNTGGDYGVMWTTTGPDGLYQFTGVQPGSYFLRIEYGSFAPGQPLFGLRSSAGEADPSNGVDNDDNGMDSPYPLYQAVHSPVFTVTASGGPTNDGDDDKGNQAIDFGFYAPAEAPVLSLGHRVWRDLNGDGFRQPEEPGIPNVGLNLFRDLGEIGRDGADQYLAGTGTDANGEFHFYGLPPGDYVVEVGSWNFNLGGALYGLLSSPGAADPETNTANDDNGRDNPMPVNWGIASGRITLSAGGEPTNDGDDANGNLTLDFGFYSPSEPPILVLGGAVFKDLNGNGVKDAGEPGVPNVGMSIIEVQPDGTEIGQGGANTDANGNYRFYGRPAGRYYARVDGWNFNAGAALAGWFSTPGAADANNDTLGDDNGVDAVSLQSQGIRSWPVTLTHSTEPDVAVDGDDTNGNLTVDFAFVELPGGPNLSVGGTVFGDTNNNGYWNGDEAGVENVSVELWIDNGDGVFGSGDGYVAATGTSGGGNYRFDNLPPADYLVAVNRGNFLNGPLVGYATSTGNDPAPGPNNDVDGDDNGANVSGFGQAFYGVASRAVSLRSGTEPTGEDGDPNTNLTVDFGFVPDTAMTLGGTVFQDTSNNGLLEPSIESGIAGVVVDLWIDGNHDGRLSEGDWPVRQAVTDSNGRWSLRLPPGNDYLAVIRYWNFMPGRPLNGLRSSTGNGVAPDPDNDVDNDDNGDEYAGFGRLFSAVASLPVTLTLGGEPTDDGDTDPNTNFTLDFGFYPGPTTSVGNLVFLDANNNGIRDPGEPGLLNVHVKLFFDNGDGVLGDADEDLGVDVTTDAAGNYALPGLPDGDYLVVLPYDNWWPGHALNGLRSSTKNDPAPDPDTDATDNDDNGEERTLSWWPSVSVASRRVTLHAGTDNPTVDFGFYSGPTLAMGGTLFRDQDSNGRFELAAGESGLPNTVVELYVDSNPDGVLSPGDQWVGRTRSDADGNYRFEGLMPGNYLVWISRWEHFYGQGLTGLRTSTIVSLNPNDDVDHDNNAAEYFDPGSGWWAADATAAVTLNFGTEPDVAIDGDGPDSNLTIDLGFRPIVGRTFVVNSADDHDDGSCDSGDCTLREAINAANNNAGKDTIAFNLAGAGVHTIQPTAVLPEIIEPVDLDATTQPGYAGLPLIELDGRQAGGTAPSLMLRGGNSRVRGFVINRFALGGLHLSHGGHNVVQGNFLGTDASGTAALSNGTSGYGGIYINGSNDNLVGGTDPAARNLISGNDLGINAQPADRTTIQGNYVGTDLTGTLALGNTGWAGIVVSGRDNLVGGTAAGAGNLVSGNNANVDPWSGYGVYVGGEGAGNRIEGNLVGTDITGTVALPNKTGIGAWGTATRVGGTAPGAGNLVSGNAFDGIAAGIGSVIEGNLVGLNKAGTAALGNARIGVTLSQNVRLGGPTAASRNVISGNNGQGISACSGGTANNVIQGNYIGTDITGSLAIPVGPGWLPGIFICSGTEANLIVGNVFAGNEASELDIRSAHNTIQDNFIGTDATGTVALSPTPVGISLNEAAHDNLIAGNLIAGLGSHGIQLNGANVNHNRILGNRIGTDVNGTSPLPAAVGIYLNESPDNQIGGAAPGEANTIAFNHYQGVVVGGTGSINNTIRGNSIHSNGAADPNLLGIDLAYGPVVNPNDPGDADEGPNHVQNHPVLLQAAASGTALAVEGQLSSQPNTRFLVDFYASSQCDPSGYGEGERYLGASEVTTDADGDAFFHVNLSAVVPPGQVVAATATDPAGNTSEFSACREVVAEGAPTMPQAATYGSPSQVAVYFSESVDPASASDAHNYAVGCGLSVLSAAMLDNRTVLLKLDGSVSGPSCTVGVSGVRDLADPPNTIAANTQGTIFQALGMITRREYRIIQGGQVTDLTNHPRFPNRPSVIDYPTLLESPSNIGDNYGLQMLGYVHPPVTGDYVFYISADDTAELYLSTDDRPSNRQLIARERSNHEARQWVGGAPRKLNVAPEQVLVPGAFFVEVEDFNHSGGQHEVAADAMPYIGGAYAGKSSVADIDYHDDTRNDAPTPEYRATDIPVEVLSTTVNGPLNGDRGTFGVTVNYKVCWTAPGEWLNYTRDFGPAQNFYVYLAASSGNPAISAELHEVTDGAGSATQATVKLGDFLGGSIQNYGLMEFVPLLDGTGQPVTVNLGGVRTLRLTAGPWDMNWDYLAFVPATGTPPAFRPENRSVPIRLIAGERYYIEALMKEGGGNDVLGIAWQLPGGSALHDGDAPIPGAHLEAWIEPHVTPAPFVSLGGLVFKDEDNNGHYDPPTDTPIPGVNVELWYDQDNNNWLYYGDWAVAYAITDDQGRYHFDGLHPASYLVLLPESEHYYGRPLTDLRTSTGNDPAPDPDTDLPGRDTGWLLQRADLHVRGTVTWACTLTAGGEPDAAVDGDGTSGNRTVDLGFQPILGTTFIVNTPDDHDDGSCDTGDCTLREAINAANASPGKDSITFNIPNPGPHTIRPTSWLPDLREPVRLDATTQPGYSGQPLVELSGEFAGAGVIGLRVYGGLSEVRGLCINRFTGGGLQIAYGGHNTISACFIGTDITGTFAPLAFQGCYCYGGLIVDTAANLIGGTDPADRNLISGYDTGVWIRGRQNVVVGNYIGTDITGSLAIGNSGGIGVEGGAENVIGGTTPGARNIISGNGTGIWLSQYGNKIQGNYIGTDVTGRLALPNSIGITAYGDSTHANLIGGTQPGAGNVISGNGTAMDIRSNRNVVQGNLIGLDANGTTAIPSTGGGIGLYDQAADNLIGGVEPGARNVFAGLGWRAIHLNGVGVQRTVIQGNYLGTDITGSTAIPNMEGVFLQGGTHANVIGGTAPGAGNLITSSRGGSVVVMDEGTVGNPIRGNSIFGNGIPDAAQLGIDLGYDGVTLNDTGDADTGPNLRQNSPELLYAASSGASLMVEGDLASTPSMTFSIDFYANPDCDPTGYGEGKTYLGSTEVTADATGHAYLLANLPVTVAPGQVVTATATDSAGNTSEFSRCRTVEAEGPPVLISANTHGLPNQITLVFSESLDPVSAGDVTHYLIPGVIVLSATLGPDGRTVTLETSLLPDGILTIEYAGLFDRAVPPNVVAGGTTGTIFNTQGLLTRSVWFNLPGSLVAQLTSAPNYPDRPDLISYEPFFESPNDTADLYGQRLAGYLIAPVTGDYVFYVASDDSSELWLSPDDNPANKTRIARITYWLHSETQKRAWNAPPVNAPASQVLRADTLFVEAEDFDFGDRQWITDQPIGMNGPYLGGAYAGLGSPADEGIDFHEYSADATADNYRPATGIEMYPVTEPAGDPRGHFDRGSFQVAQSWKIGWNYLDEWRNYTRDFPEGDYWVFARAAADGGPIAGRLDSLEYAGGPQPVSSNKLGEFHSNGSNGWDNFVFVPLIDDLGEAVRVHLAGLQTLRITVIPGGLDLDYLAFVPAQPGDEPPANRPENRSAPIHLVAGQRYYVEALGKENLGGDHLSVTWQMPGGTAPLDGDPPIPGQYLSSLSPSGPVSITRNPQDLSRDEYALVTFSVGVQGTPPFTYQWLRNGIPIPGATAYRFDQPASMADDGARFSVVVNNGFSQATSTEALLHVTPDTEAPRLIAGMGGPSLDQVIIKFSEPMSASAGDPAHYSLNGGLSVTAAVLQPDLTTVVLRTTTQVANIRYTLSVAGVTDRAYAPNPVASDTAMQFSSWAPARGFVLHQFFQDVFGNAIDNLRNDPRFPNNPTVTESLERSEWPPNAGNEGGSNYGNRLSGWLVPPADGPYIFYVASDDPSEVYLSSDEHPASKRLICSEPAWNNPRAYRTLDRRNPSDPENVSDPIPLLAGHRYYFEILHTEGGGGDNVSLAWQMPGGPEVHDGDLPIDGRYVESYVNPDQYAPTLAALDPKEAAANSSAFTLQVTGTKFRSDSVISWNGSARTTTFVDDHTLEAAIPASDLAMSAELATATVTVVNFLGVASNPAVFTVKGTKVLQADSVVASLGETAAAASPAANTSEAGVSAAVQNEGNPDPIVITTATYDSLPVDTAPKFDVGGGYADIKVSGADAADSATSYFYYPASLTPEQAAAATLLYFNGSAWVAVLSSGGVMPVKDMTPNLDGTISGGRFTVVFDHTSLPKLTELAGSVFTTTEPDSQPPIARDDILQRVDDDTFKVRVAYLLSNDSDPDGDPLTLTGVSPTSARGGSVTLQGAWVIYQSRPGDRALDSFTYTISDGRNGLAVGKVTLQPPQDPGAGQNQLSGQLLGGKMHLEFAGIPGRTYRVQYTTDLGTGVWVELASPVVCGPDGLVRFTDPDVLEPLRIYRTVSP